jgi:hypothetical protein
MKAKLMNSLTILVKSRDQIVGDHLSGTAFYLMTFDHMYQLTIFKQGNGW